MRRATGSLPLPRGRSLFAHHRGVVAEGLGLQVAPRGGEGLVRAARGQKDPEAINVTVVALVDSRLPVAARRPRAAELVHAATKRGGCRRWREKARAGGRDHPVAPPPDVPHPVVESNHAMAAACGDRNRPAQHPMATKERTEMARSKAQMTHAKRDRERARLEKRAQKRDKKEARKLAASDAAASPETPPPTTLPLATPSDTPTDREPTA